MNDRTSARSASEGITTPASLPLRVIKVGGSLLTWPSLPAALHSWLDAQSPACNILVCGGGPLAEAVREADRTFGLDERAAHWLAIEAMHVTARLLAAVLKNYPLCESCCQLTESIGDRTNAATIVFDVRSFLRDQDQNTSQPLPQDWTVTSDSIAARLATVLKADELVLLKSADSPAGALDELSVAGYVDDFFPRAAAALSRVRSVNLRTWRAAAGVSPVASAVIASASQ